MEPHGHFKLRCLFRNKIRPLFLAVGSCPPWCRRCHPANRARPWRDATQRSVVGPVPTMLSASGLMAVMWLRESIPAVSLLEKSLSILVACNCKASIKWLCYMCLCDANSLYLIKISSHLLFKWSARAPGLFQKKRTTLPAELGSANKHATN